MGRKVGRRARVQGFGHGGFYVDDFEVGLQDAKDAIGRHEPADTGLLLEPACSRNQPPGWGVGVTLQLLQDPLGQPIEVG